MKKRFITGFACGALIFGTVGVFAGQYVAVENPFSVQLNGENVNIEGYNINDNTYFKLRDIADIVGGFEVDFQNNTILLSKDGYIYNIPDTNSVSYFSEEKFSFLPDYGVFNDLETTAFYEYSDGSAHYYEYPYNESQVNNYINYLKDLGYNVYNQPSDITYNYNGTTQIYLAANTPVIEYNGNYASLKKNDLSGYLAVTVYGNKSPEQAGSNVENFIESMKKNSLDSFMQYSFPAGYEPVTDYSIYNMHAFENGLENKKISISGYVTDVVNYDNIIYAVLQSYNNPNEEWLVILSTTGYSSYDNLYTIFKDKYVVFGGSYMGYSDAKNLPSVLFECATVYEGKSYNLEDIILLQ